MAITFLSTDELKTMLTASADLCLLDVRTPEEYDYLGHIPGSKLIPLHELPGRWQELDPEAKTVVYCQHGVRSLDASHYLNHLGFAEVYNLSEGFEPWDGPIERKQ
jgi:rhodanese-related sulfurtransferase